MSDMIGPYDYIRAKLDKGERYSSEMAAEIKDRFSLSSLGAKSLWLSTPEFQEEYCRNRIKDSQERGGSEYGNRHWLKRNFNLSEAELDEIFFDIWNNPKDRVSTKFLDALTPERIAETQLVDEGRQAVKDIQNRFYGDTR
ncbi:hypothetical protein [Alterisphingorhabdus coralli]|uniref:Uncharacterized protein n=1 Tax=Alterisphingorhabdus coralli TaxID=3071408 RepID=A0AA97F839_9SPHN|nr:hypothetical protein [Parasphingorhabdus sp. SCSIO 66989]WOE75216.1 hypothetical protein RB602_00410 [Parasphingorhabdus sp. SCSIO 66989]